MTKTQIIQLTDWREQGKLEYRSDFGGWCSRSEFSTHEKFENFRIKPTPTLRPWRPEEVPVGAHIKHKINTGYRSVIIAQHGEDTMVTAGVQLKTERAETMLSYYQHSLDQGKTWLPCGVLE